MMPAPLLQSEEGLPITLEGPSLEFLLNQGHLTCYDIELVLLHCDLHPDHHQLVLVEMQTALVLLSAVGVVGEPFRGVDLDPSTDRELDVVAATSEETALPGLAGYYGISKISALGCSPGSASAPHSFCICVYGKSAIVNSISVFLSKPTSHFH
jgi:hypothetical protein